MSRWWYILDDDHNPVPATTEEWERFVGRDDDPKRVAFTEIEATQVSVSTVFLGIDHNFLRKGPPVLFETMVFGPSMRDDPFDIMRRYHTWDEALAGHYDIVATVRRAMFRVVGRE